MKLLFLRHVYIWPRFHVQVSNELEFVEESVNSRSLNGTSHAEENQQQEKGITLIELRVPLSRLMKEIQAGLVDCLEACIQELKRCNPYVRWENGVWVNAMTCF